MMRGLTLNHLAPAHSCVILLLEHVNGHHSPMQLHSAIPEMASGTAVAAGRQRQLGLLGACAA